MFLMFLLKKGYNLKYKLILVKNMQINEPLDPETLRNLSRQDLVRYYASRGDANSVAYMTIDGALEKLPEAEQRRIVAQAYSESANLHDRMKAEGRYHIEEWRNPKLQEVGTTYSRDMRAIALEILFNPEGELLRKQLLKYNGFCKVD
jgi:hypothetical protein